jgi:flagellar biosynthesis chaperone FliJ
MTNPKIEKVKGEIEKVKAKISDFQAKLRDLEREKLRLENEQIVALVRGGDLAALAGLNDFISDAELHILKKPPAAEVKQPNIRQEVTDNAIINEN